MGGRTNDGAIERERRGQGRDGRPKRRCAGRWRARLDRHHHHPRNEPGGETAGEPGAIGDQPARLAAEARWAAPNLPVRGEKDGDADRRQQPEEGGGTVQRRLAADHEVDRKDTKREQSAEEMRGNEGLVARRRQWIAARELMYQRAKIG